MKNFITLFNIENINLGYDHSFNFIFIKTSISRLNKKFKREIIPKEIFSILKIW